VTAPAGVTAQSVGAPGASHYAEVNGVRLHYVAAGDGPLMLFLHGFPEFWMAWREALGEFCRDHFVVAPDLRGYNLSGKPEGVKAYRPHEIVEDIHQLIHLLDRGPAVLVAHDWGGAVAWNFAAQYPNHVRKLVIINSPHPMMFLRELSQNPAQQAASDYMLLFQLDKAERVLAQDDYARLRRQLDDWKRSPNPPDAATLQAYFAAWTQPGALTAMINWYRASPVRPMAPDDPLIAALALRKSEFVVNVPTLVIWGERDVALLPSLLDGLGEYVPDLRIERVAEGSHWVAHEYPERVHALIRDFIA
jgi:pimeloyl-ACP methyl ester carboxylesterase